MNELHQAIRDVLAKEPMPFEALHGCLQDRLENKKQLANALTALKAKKVLERDGDGNYRLRVSGETKPGRRGRRPGKTPPIAPAVRAAARALDIPAETAQRHLDDARDHGNGTLAAQLEQLERAAQDALDDYLFSLADPAMLTPLRTARDAAREARARWQAKEGTC